jgi:hypothetical protein
MDNSNLVCDVRYSINYYPNSVTATEFAGEEMKIDKVLIEVLYSPAADEDDEDCFLLPPPLTPEYECLQEVPWSTWYYDYVISRQFTVPDLLDELFAITSVKEYWICLKCSDHHLASALVKLEEVIPDGVRAIVVSDNPIGSLPPKLHGCDPTGSQRYKLIFRPGSFSEDAALMTSRPPIIPNTFAMDGHPAAEFRTINLP